MMLYLAHIVAIVSCVVAESMTSIQFMEHAIKTAVVHHRIEDVLRNWLHLAFFNDSHHLIEQTV